MNSPLLFNIYINMILEEFNFKNGYKEINKILFYADDAVLKFRLKDQITALTSWYYVLSST